MRQAAELTFWFAVTPCEVLVAEEPSSSSASAVRRLSLRAGQCASWAGHKLAYGAAPNDSQRTTVSFDFHVIPWSLYSESRDSSRRSSHDLRLGGYYAVMEAAR